MSTVLAVTVVLSLAGSETPPPGPPWLRTLPEAQAQALGEGKPIFVYLTKTH